MPYIIPVEVTVMIMNVSCDPLILHRTSTCSVMSNVGVATIRETEPYMHVHISDVTSNNNNQQLVYNTV